VEIKATQSSRVSFRHKSEFAIVIKINPDGIFDEIYNGPGELVWMKFSGNRLPSNGQYSITLKQLKALNSNVMASERIERNRSAHNEPVTGCASLKRCRRAY